jgi:hypothetical protein
MGLYRPRAEANAPPNFLVGLAGQQACQDLELPFRHFGNPTPRPVGLLILLIFPEGAGCGQRHCSQKLVRTIRNRQEVHGSSFHHLHPKGHVAFGVTQNNDRQADAPGLELPRNDQTTSARPANIENDAPGCESRSRLQEGFAGRKDPDPVAGASK